jgi:hypothetical protein
MLLRWSPGLVARLGEYRLGLALAADLAGARSALENLSFPGTEEARSTSEISTSAIRTSRTLTISTITDIDQFLERSFTTQICTHPEV